MKKCKCIYCGDENFDGTLCQECGRHPAGVYCQRGNALINDSILLLKNKKVLSALILAQLGIELIFKAFLLSNGVTEEEVKKYQHDNIKLYDQCFKIDKGLDCNDFRFLLSMTKISFGDVTKLRYSKDGDWEDFEIKFPEEMKKLSDKIIPKIKLY